MRSDRVFTNLTCNQNCLHCASRSAADDRAFVQTRAVRERIGEVLEAGAREVVLTGGEPSLRRDLPELIAFTRQAGAQVVLETNATLIDAARATALREAGLATARVNVSGLAGTIDRVTRDEGGAARTLAGIRALRAAGVPVELDLALVASTLPELSGFPARLRDDLGELRSFKGMQLRVPVDSPEPSELISYEAAAAAIAGLEDAARRLQLQLRLSPDSGPPPCIFRHPTRVAHLYSLTAGASRREGYMAVEACASCQLSDRCPGLPRTYLARRPAPPMQPVADDRLRRRLSLIGSVEDQVRREHVQPSRNEMNGRVIEERLIRVNFQCNQSCRFCFVSTHLPAAADEATRDAIRRAGAEGAKVVLTGGEPTLNPNLLEYVRLARDCSAFPVNLQTNATRLGDPAAVAALVEAGLAEVFVSLHGSTAETSDAITEAPGTFEKTVAGIDAVVNSPLLVCLNFVICQRNIPDLVPYVRMVAARWPRALVNISFVAPMSDVVPREAALIPRYSDVLPQLGVALGEARRLGVKVVGFESMCGVPLCLVPADLTPYLNLTDIPEGFDAGEFVKTATCRQCSLERKCYGLRRGYRELHGDAELRAQPAFPGESAGPPIQ